MLICPKDECTGCWACLEVCPKSCIEKKKDNLAAEYPVINDTLCVRCGLCKKICPNNTLPIFRYPKKVYAGWSKDPNTRKSSASGGVATELYLYYLLNNGVSVGVTMDSQHSAKYILLDNVEDIPKVRNSKYTFSNTDYIYSKVKTSLDNGREVLFIGLPCQVAALLNYLKKSYDNLTTVDIICHGVPPADYLMQHIRDVENTLDKKTASCTFRYPKYGTHNFVFALFDEYKKCFYHKRVLSNDVYQLGYHKALIYRENCYHCKYARPERISDITIGDFSGLGRVKECDFSSVNVSCVMVNTTRGEQLLLQAGLNVAISERPIEEALNYEKQLNEPSKKHLNRTIFEALYCDSNDFKLSATAALEGDIANSVVYPNSIPELIKSIIRIVLPFKLRKFIKTSIKKINGK